MTNRSPEAVISVWKRLIARYAAFVFPASRVSLNCCCVFLHVSKTRRDGALAIALLTQRLGCVVSGLTGRKGAVSHNRGVLEWWKVTAYCLLWNPSSSLHSIIGLSWPRAFLSVQGIWLTSLFHTVRYKLRDYLIWIDWEAELWPWLVSLCRIGEG